MSQQRTKRPFGTWTSHLTPDWMGSGTGLVDPQWSGGQLLWLEKRSDRTALVSHDAQQGYRDLTYEHKIRGGLFYGGGDFSCREGWIAFVDKDGGLFVHSVSGGVPRLVVSAGGASAAPSLSPDGRFALYIHVEDDNDRLMVVSLQEADVHCRIAAQGADFYMQPVWHPLGGSIAWVEWSHPQMPWQGSRLMKARFDPASGQVDQVACLAGDEHTPIFQPEFSPDGKWLAWLENVDEWDSLMLSSVSGGQKRPILTGKSMLIPAWLQGMRVIGWAPDSRGIYVIGNEAGFSVLWKVDIFSGEVQQLCTAPYTYLAQISINPSDGRIALLASSPKHTPRLLVLEGNRQSIIRTGMPETITADELPEARPVSWNTKAGEIFGIFYSPTHPQYDGEGLPPVILHVHSGPTSQVQANFSADTAFFTSRGFAYLSLNYRGSTGFGRSYREALDNNWGISDVEDTLSAVAFLQSSGLADADRIILKGSSAGGFTVLNTLISYPGRFRAAICAYGVANLGSIVDETFKFESHYYDSLIGPPQESATAMQERSPIYRADQICDPILLFHGSDDPVVPITQTEEIVACLEKNQVPYRYVRFEGEGHGWRKSETLESYYSIMEEFLKTNL